MNSWNGTRFQLDAIGEAAQDSGDRLSRGLVGFREPQSRFFRERIVITSGLIALAVALATFSVALFTSRGPLIRNDGLAYFMYARSLVVDLDVDITQEFEDIDLRFPGESTTVWKEKSKVYIRRGDTTGRIVLPWPVGSGVVMAPFYAIGYIVESIVGGISGRPADSYGVIPQLFFSFGSVAYGLLGFWCMFLCCLRVTEEKTALVSAAAIAIGGPLLFYVFSHPSMSHAMSFGPVSLLTLLWLQGWRRETSRIWLLGFLLGVLVTIRPQNILFAILPAALVLRNGTTSRLSAVKEATFSTLAFLVPVVALFALQYGTVYGVGEVSFSDTEVSATVGRFDRSSPNFLRVLFSCQNGAFYWAPTLAIGFAGLLWATGGESWSRVLVITFLAHVYLVGGFDVWHGGRSFGARYLTESGPFLALGLAMAIDTTARAVKRYAWPTALGILAGWNCLLALSYAMGTIPRGGCASYKEMMVGAIRALGQILM